MTTPNVQTIGFARYSKHPSASAEDLITTCLRWRHEFLDQQPGILAHRLLGNLKGRFADIVMADSRQSFDAMAAAHPQAESSRALLERLDPTPSR